MNRKLERNQFKKNFLKETIMRLDFQGVLQAEMENILLEVKPYLKSQSFNRYSEKINNQAVVEGTTIKETSSQVVYSFVNENSGYTLDLCTTSIILIVRTVGYAPFEHYSEIFAHVATVYKNKIDFFTVTRFGFRKINFCFVKGISDIGKYFEQKYYGVDEPISEFDTATVNRTSHLSDGKKNVNLTYMIELGDIDRDSYYKVTLDSDIYSTDDETIQSVLDNSEQMADINETLFSIYCGVITEEFAVILTSGEVMVPDGLVGVDDNE